jgi:hypothetical protein
MHVSAALDTLLSHHPRLIHRAHPFGMSIGVEVFALATNPLVDAYPALKSLVLNFKSQFAELGIEPRMVRRATHHRHAHTDNADDSPETGEAQLRAWLRDWLGSVNARQSRGAQWVLSGAQIRELLGPDIYPYSPAEESGAGKETGARRPTQEQLERMKEILGPHILDAMVKIWTSPHTRVFANPLVAEVEDFVTYVAEVAWLEGGKGEPELELETLFPSPPRRVQAWTVDMEEHMQLLQEQGRGRPLSIEEQLQLLEALGRKAWLRATAENERGVKETAKNEMNGAGAVEKWE